VAHDGAHQNATKAAYGKDNHSAGNEADGNGKVAPATSATVTNDNTSFAFDGDQGNNSDTVVIEQIKQLVGQFKVFNFGVDTYHTYFIGDGIYVLVHNPLTIMNSDGSVNRKETDAHKKAFEILLHYEANEITLVGSAKYFGMASSPSAEKFMNQFIPGSSDRVGRHGYLGLALAHMPQNAIGGTTGFLITKQMEAFEPTTTNSALAEKRKGAFLKMSGAAIAKELYDLDVEGAATKMIDAGGTEEADYYRRMSRQSFKLFYKDGEVGTALEALFIGGGAAAGGGGGGGGGGAAAGGAGCSCK
ncbi:MAG: hypothetical protein J0G29_05975, partial [Alphaproteobacteria bacterium]|nr:hypothetical protein [Alphaproteobacteria bacterium]